MTEPVVFDSKAVVKPHEQSLEVAYYQALLKLHNKAPIGSSGPAHDGVDGIYSDAMQNKVRAFQQHYGMNTEVDHKLVTLQNGLIDGDTSDQLITRFVDSYNRDKSPTDPTRLAYPDGNRLTPEIRAALEEKEPSLAALKHAQSLGSPAAPHVTHTPSHPAKPHAHPKPAPTPEPPNTLTPNAPRQWRT